MFILTVENEKGDKLRLTQDEGNYQIVDIDGLNPPKGNIIRTEIAGMDGSRFASSKLEERNIVLTIKINGDVERNRLRLYRYFRTKRHCKLYFSHGSRDIYAEGWVEDMPNNLFKLGQTVQVSILCPDPYLKSVSEIISDISKVLANFEFPFAFGANGVVPDTLTDDAIEFSTYDEERIVNIFNEGESDVGMIITLTAVGEVKNPTIYNVGTRAFLKLNVSMVDGDVITINTNRGSKGVTMTRDNITTNIIDALDYGSSWLNLEVGDNMFTYDVETGLKELFIVFTHRLRYEAV